MSKSKVNTKSRGPKSLKKVLVVGDWFLDEHWVIGVHRSLTSSRTGKAHYRAMHKASSTVESLCGAGRTASILHQVKCGGEPYCEIVGIGLWHKEDTGILTRMLDPKCEEAKTPHQITRARINDGRRRLFNLDRVLKKRAGEGAEHVCGTTRIIRIYQHTGSGFELLQRIDWELRLPQSESLVSEGGADGDGGSERHSAVVMREEELDNCGLKSWLGREIGSVDAVVIKDVGKAVVSEAIIRWLVAQFERAKRAVPWFISTKAWSPGWFGALPKRQVRLMLIPQMAARQVVSKTDLNRWITRSGHASSRALKVMEKLGEEFPKALIVTLPDGLSVLARDCCEDDAKRVGVVQTQVGERELSAGMPMASVFFPALIAGVLKDEEARRDTPLKERLKAALRFTHRWMSMEVKRVEEPERWVPKDAQTLDLSPHDDADDPDREDESDRVKPFDGNWKEFNWQQAMGHWDSAFSNLGVIEEQDGSKKCLELWRAMTEVDGYVCCMEEKRTILQRVVNELGAFDAGGKDSKSCMFIASPGSGKTFLVRSMAVTLGMRYLGFNITQMIAKGDLLDCFDTIVTSQAQQNRGERLLVFFDEINAKLDGQHVYDAFLAPLEEGVYVRAGKTFHIDPCVWVFAGTERPKVSAEAKADKSDKASDFESRLTLEPLDLKIKATSPAEMEEAMIEKIYLGVSLLRTIFQDVRYVSTKVLSAFHKLPPGMEARELKNFVRYFTNIRYGEVDENNVPEDRLAQLCGDIRDWKLLVERKGDMVEIRG